MAGDALAARIATPEQSHHISRFIPNHGSRIANTRKDFRVLAVVANFRLNKQLIRRRRVLEIEVPPVGITDIDNRSQRRLTCGTGLRNQAAQLSLSGALGGAACVCLADGTVRSVGDCDGCIDKELTLPKADCSGLPDQILSDRVELMPQTVRTHSPDHVARPAF